MHDPTTIGIVSISDRASTGVYQGLPALKEWLAAALHNPLTFVERLIPDEQAVIERTLVELAGQCCLVLTPWLRPGPGRAPARPPRRARRR
ncbi:MAG: hypothetical protein WC474_08610 [Hydrogenophilaceae bacterium]